MINLNKQFILITHMVIVLLYTTGMWAKQHTQTILDVPQTEIQYLSGHGSDDAVSWKFFCTDGRNSGKWTTIPVPSCWELHGFGTYQYGMPFYGKANPPGIAKEKGIYQYTFKLPQAWSERKIRIVFEGVMTDCEVKINDRKCIKLHQGAFYQFKGDITDRVYFGSHENKLEVTVSKESENESVNLAERRADYWNFGGIIRPVFIEALPFRNIDRVAIDAKANGIFHADVYLGSALSHATITTQLSDKDGKVVGRTIETEIRAGSDRAQVEGSFSGVQNWSPETPHLYYATFTLTQMSNANKKILHVVRERFGFRTVVVKLSDGLYINGQKVNIRGVNRHSFRPETGRTLSKKDNYDDVKLIKEMNMNAVRLSHYPSDPEFLDACDEMGLYVMVELGGWHGKYDSNVGKKLINEMITRDVNHPCVTWWSNGNEGGWNTELDGEFHALDPQKRPVIHPQGNFSGFETMHYRSYGESQEYMRKPEIFMPTEFLHGLYDGGLGAGLWDYWEMMRKHPRCAGGFLWAFSDEGVVRTDQNNRIDCAGSFAPDGIVGPHHEKEGSFNTIKQVWSPVQIMNKELPHNFDGIFKLENRYDFINLKDCRFHWKLEQFSLLPGKIGNALDSGNCETSSIAAHGSGTLKIDLPTGWQNADALYLTAYDPYGDELWTWSWTWKKNTDFFSFAGPRTKICAIEDSSQLKVYVGSTTLFFSTESGELNKVEKDNKKISFGEGPRFIAARRGDRSMDQYYNHDDKEARSKERIYEDISGKSKLIQFTYKTFPDSISIDAKYFGNMSQTHWCISYDGNIRLDYEYEYDGTVELMGIKFDYPEEYVLSKRWLGNGPYRVWQNRLRGTRFGLWENKYNDPIPGESFIYPEFKGYFYNWKWMSLETQEGNIFIGNASSDQFIGIYTPRDGRDAQLYTLPQTGIAILKVIPAVRNKVNATDLIGPSSQSQWSDGIQRGSLYFKF